MFAPSMGTMKRGADLCFRKNSSLRRSCCSTPSRLYSTAAKHSGMCENQGEVTGAASIHYNHLPQVLKVESY